MMRLLIALMGILTPAMLLAADAAQPGLKAGAATSNITPDIGLDIIGGFAPIPSTNIHDELNFGGMFNSIIAQNTKKFDFNQDK